MRPERGPRAARWLLSCCLPEHFAEDVLGDLEEEACSREEAGRPVAAWYWRQAFLLAAPLLVERLRERGSATRRSAVFVPGGLRAAIRMLARRPAETVLAVATLSVGIAVSAIAFTVVFGSLHRGLPLEDSNALVHFERYDAEEGRDLPVSPHDYVAWVEQQESFEAIAAYVEAALTLTDAEGRPVREQGIRMSANAFELLRAKAVRGRTFSAEDDRRGAPAVIVLGHQAWTSRYGADPDIVGRTIRVNGEPTVIVGVMEEGFAFPIAEQYWLPLRLDLGDYARGEGRLDAVGRLAPGATLDSAHTELAAIGERLALAFPATNAAVVPRLSSLTDEYVGEEFARLVTTMFVGALLVLVIACINVGTLLSARATEREGEMALRTALGARRSQLVGQLLLESALLSVGAGALGLGLAHYGLAAVSAAWLRMGDLGLPHGPNGMFWWRFELDVVPVFFVLLVTLGTVFLTGLVPAWHGANRGLAAGRVAAPSRVWGRRVVVLEVALTTGLLAASALTVQSVLHLSRVDYGVRTDGVVTARVGLPDVRYPDTRSRRRFWAELEERLVAEPGVRGVSVTTTLPVRRSRATPVAVLGRDAERPRDRPRTRTSTVSASFFEVFDLPIVEGRGFAASDREGASPVAVVNVSFADMYFPGESPLGRQIRVGASDADEPWRLIVGVVPNLWMDGPRQRNADGVYLPLAQSRSPYGVGLRYLSVALAGDAGVERLRDVVASLDPELPVYSVRTMDELVADATGRYRTYGVFYIALGAIALFLTCLALYGVLSSLVHRSSVDIGVRMALGAGRGRILRLYLGRGLAQVALGIALGVVPAYVLSVRLRSALFDVEPRPEVFVVVALALLATSALACWLPARRASLVAPMTAVREG